MWLLVETGFQHHPTVVQELQPLLVTIFGSIDHERRVAPRRIKVAPSSRTLCTCEEPSNGVLATNLLAIDYADFCHLLRIFRIVSRDPNDCALRSRQSDCGHPCRNTPMIKRIGRRAA